MGLLLFSSEKRLPGAVTVRFVYDQHRRMVASQDGNQAQSSEWTLCRYDNLDRIVGQRLANASLANVQSGYTSLYSASTDVISEYLYDDYTAVPAAMPAYDGTIVGGLPTSHDTRTKGLKTYEKVRVLDGGSTFIERAFYYDERGRLIQTVEKNLVGVSRYSTIYDFMGNPLTTYEAHVPSSGYSYQVQSDNTYDHRNRLLATTTQFSKLSGWRVVSQQEAVVRYAYDELGRLLGKQYGEGTGAFSSLTGYNIQGWMTSQKSPHFRTELTYFQNGVQSYTGNILKWSVNYPSYEEGRQAHTYNLSYDKFGRLLAGVSSDGFDETVIPRGNNPHPGYDLNGNILSMWRYENMEQITEYSYEYQGNKLTSIIDVLDEEGFNYTYDRNANLVKDERKGLQFRYNLLNLVSEVTDNSSAKNLKARYSYSADGIKLRVRGASGEGYDYLGSVTLHWNETGSLNSVEALFADGQIKIGDANDVNYFETDHLGSVRAVVNDAGISVAVNDYYPFGMRHNIGEVNDNVRYRFNGKEIQLIGGLDILDYDARMYDPEIGRWFVQDLLAEKYRSYSPYNYCLNNPLRFVDPTGMAVEDKLLEYATSNGIGSFTSSGGTDWVQNTSTGSYEWKDSATSQSTTPEGYRHVGSESKDILDDMNLAESYTMTQDRGGVDFMGGQTDYKGDPITTPASTKVAVGLAAGIPAYIGTQALGSLSLTAVVSRGLPTDDNANGLTFDGVRVDGSITTSSTAGSYTMGNLNVYYGNASQSASLGLTPNTPMVTPSGTTTISGSVFVPAGNLNNSVYLRGASLTTGTSTKTGIIFPIEMKQSLQIRPAFRPSN